MSLLTLAPFIVGSMILSFPTFVANSLGFGFTDKFVIKGKTIVRPKHFNTKAHKAAFEDVGKYITNFLTRDLMIVYLEHALKTESFMRPKNVPLQVWKEVLEFFAQEEAILSGWAFYIWSSDPHTYKYYAPLNDAEGNRLDKKERKETFFGGEICKEGTMNFYFLSDEEKSSLMGKKYAVHPNDCIKDSTNPEKWGVYDKQEWMIVGEENFERAYFRDRASISEEDKDKGVDKFLGILAVSS